MGAGLPAWGKFTEIQTSALENAFRNKFWGYFFCAKYAVPCLSATGSIVFTIGGAARSAIPATARLAAVNGAIMCMGLTLAKEIAPIRVNILSPGLVDTPAYNWMSRDVRELRSGGKVWEQWPFCQVYRHFPFVKPWSASLYFIGIISHPGIAGSKTRIL